ncbi:TolB family protein [Coraliomargarita sp. W4R53]
MSHLYMLTRCFAFLASGSSILLSAPPDGFVLTGNESLVVMSVNEQHEVLHLTDGSNLDTIFYATHQTFSADGRYVFFESDRPLEGGHADDWQMMAGDVETGDLYRIATIPSREGYGNDRMKYHANYSAVLNRIFFCDLSATRLYVHDIKGGKTQLIYTTPSGWYFKSPPSVNNDGTWLAASIAQLNMQQSSDTHNGWLYTIQAWPLDEWSADLGEPEILVEREGLRRTEAQNQVTISHVAFSPVEPDQFIFKADGVWMASVRSKEEILLYPSVENGWRDHQSWSSDGRSINYVHNGEIGSFSLESNRHQFYVDPLVPDAWHQDENVDGSAIVYDHRSRNSNWDSFDNSLGLIAILDLESGQTEVLAETAFNKSHPRHPHPQFSPEGDLVAFNTSVEDRCRVSIVRLLSSQLR